MSDTGRGNDYNPIIYAANPPGLTFGSEEAPGIDNATLTLGVNPDPLYNLTDANFSIFYNETNGYHANITANFTINGENITENNPVTYYNISPDTTLYYFVEQSNFTKHDNLTLAANLTTYTTLETDSSTLNREIQNSVPEPPGITYTPHSVIIGDTFNATGNSTDDDDDTLSYWYLYGYDNGTNITGWVQSAIITVNSSNENDTFRVYIMADDGETNGTASLDDLNVTRLAITWPADGSEYYGKTFYYTFNATVDNFQPCEERIDNTTYDLGNITGDQNNSRYVWYGNHIYTAICYSLANDSITYNKSVNYSNYYAAWNISIYEENNWDTPLNITEANLSIIITCEGGETYVYNFTGSVITDVKPPCDVETVSAKVDYATDSYLRERMPPCSGVCEVRMYMVDAMVYTVLQIPIYMSDYQYYDSKIELYKMSGGNHYTIAEGFFDVEHKYVTYLTKDNTYLIRLEMSGQLRDIGFLYAATATAQYLSLSEITLQPSIRLISDNILMGAAFDNESLPLSTLRIQYQDLINMTESVRVQIFSNINNTAWYDNTITGSSNFTIAINDVNTSFRYSVVFTVEHAVLGNSPIPYTIGVGKPSAVDLGLPVNLAWLYGAFGFFIILVTSWTITPETRLPGILLLLAELGILSLITWFTFPAVTLMLFVAFLVAGIIYEIRHKGAT